MDNISKMWVIEELVNLGVINSDQDVLSITWYPSPPYDRYSCAAYLKIQHPFCVIESGGSIRRVAFVGRYANILFSDAALVDYACSNIEGHDARRESFSNAMCGDEVVIEHTSLTPVYPLNLATFRTSVVGNALASVYGELGQNVSVHYLVADTARNVSLVLERCCRDCVTGGDVTRAKNDHLCGRLFSDALVKIGKMGSSCRGSEMFPFACGSLPETCHDPSASPKAMRSLSDYCLQGHIQTLADACITVDCVDYQSDVLHAMGEVKGLSSAINAEGSYLQCNCAYYAHLCRANDVVYSILNHRQRYIVEKAISLLGLAARVQPIYCNDVLFKEDGKLVADRVADGRFHSVDAYVASVAEHFALEKCSAMLALELWLLSCEVNSPAIVDVDLFCNLRPYVEMAQALLWFSNLSRCTCDSISTADVVLAKRLIQFESLFSRAVVIRDGTLLSFNPHCIVRYLDRLCRDVVSQYRDSQHINARVFNSASSVIAESFKWLGLFEIYKQVLS